MSKVNKIKQYLAEVKNVSPIRIGNGDEYGNGMLLIDNKAVISGTTLAGLFKHFLHKKVKDKEVFNNNGDISNIYFNDAFSKEDIDSDDLGIRNRVKIDYKNSTSMVKCLFEECSVKEGKTFVLTFEVRGLDIDEKDYTLYCNLLEEFIYNIATGQIPVGSNTTLGFGILKIVDDQKYYCYEFDLTQECDLEKYLKSEGISKEKLEPNNITEINNKGTENNKIIICFRGYCEDGFIIKGQFKEEKIKSGKNEEDKSKYVDESYFELNNDKKYYAIPAATIKGIIRCYAAKIYKTLDRETNEIDNIFGKRKNDERKLTSDEISKGKVIFNDSKIVISKPQRYNRIRVDRFTGGAMKGSLFSEDLLVVPQKQKNYIEIKVNTEKCNKKAVALIILAFRDIGLGYVTIGSGNNVGYGRFTGESIEIDEGSSRYKVTFDKDKGFTGAVDEFEKIISYI